MRAASPLPTQIADIAIPQDDISVAIWRWAQRSLPDYLFMGRRTGRRILARSWTKALF